MKVKQEAYRASLGTLVAAIVLAGGKSSRLGKDKTRETLDGETLLGRVLKPLMSLSAETLIVGLKEFPGGSPLPSGVRVVEDYSSGMGPLGGIYTGLSEISSHHSLVVACDMPFLNRALLVYMIELAPGNDFVVPRLGGELEPLHAIYSKNCLEPMSRRLQQGELRIIGFAEEVKVRIVEETEVDRFDPEHLSFFNINTEDDLKRARELLRAEENRGRQ